MGVDLDVHFTCQLGKTKPLTVINSPVTSTERAFNTCLSGRQPAENSSNVAQTISTKECIPKVDWMACWHCGIAAIASKELGYGIQTRWGKAQCTSNISHSTHFKKVSGKFQERMISFTETFGKFQRKLTAETFIYKLRRGLPWASPRKWGLTLRVGLEPRCG